MRNSRKILDALRHNEIMVAASLTRKQLPRVTFRDQAHILMWSAVLASCPNDGNGSMRNLRNSLKADSPNFRHRALRIVQTLSNATRTADYYGMALCASKIRAAAPETERIVLAGVLLPMVFDAAPDNPDWWADQLQQLLGPEQ